MRASAKTAQDGHGGGARGQAALFAQARSHGRRRRHAYVFFAPTKGQRRARDGVARRFRRRARRRFIDGDGGLFRRRRAPVGRRDARRRPEQTRRNVFFFRRRRRFFIRLLVRLRERASRDASEGRRKSGRSEVLERRRDAARAREGVYRARRGEDQRSGSVRVRRRRENSGFFRETYRPLDSKDDRSGETGDAVRGFVGAEDAGARTRGLSEPGV
mmetsp:Transcript_10576/g.44311  ORF Transcript_10576/g.44311 Transcript_10576/m.44311 type:complete len:216 (-) Transcript_10576:259-906(-)